MVTASMSTNLKQKLKKLKLIRQKLVINLNFVICASASNFTLEILDCIQKIFSATLLTEEEEEKQENPSYF